MPILTPDSNRSSFWSTTAVVSSPVPSSLSSGSYREVALVPKEARVHLESQGSTGAETPMRMGMLGGPVLLGTPLQFGESILSHAHDPGWSKPDAEKNQGSHTIWMLDAPGMQDTSLDQTKKQQWMSSEQTTEPVPAAKNQEVLRPPLQEDIGSHNQKESCHPDSPQVKRAGQTPLGGQPPLAEQAPSTKQPPLPASKGLSRVFSNTTVQKHQFFGCQCRRHELDLWSGKISHAVANGSWGRSWTAVGTDPAFTMTLTATARSRRFPSQRRKWVWSLAKAGRR